MGLFRDRRDRRDLSLKVCWTLAVWLMTQQLRWVRRERGRRGRAAQAVVRLPQVTLRDISYACMQASPDRPMVLGCAPPYSCRITGEKTRG